MYPHARYVLRARKRPNTSRDYPAPKRQFGNNEPTSACREESCSSDSDNEEIPVWTLVKVGIPSPVRPPKPKMRRRIRAESEDKWYSPYHRDEESSGESDAPGTPPTGGPHRPTAIRQWLCSVSAAANEQFGSRTPSPIPDRPEFAKPRPKTPPPKLSPVLSSDVPSDLTPSLCQRFPYFRYTVEGLKIPNRPPFKTFPTTLEELEELRVKRQEQRLERKRWRFDPTKPIICKRLFQDEDERNNETPEPSITALTDDSELTSDSTILQRFVAISQKREVPEQEEDEETDQAESPGNVESNNDVSVHFQLLSADEHASGLDDDRLELDPPILLVEEDLAEGVPEPVAPQDASSDSGIGDDNYDNELPFLPVEAVLAEALPEPAEDPPQDASDDDATSDDNWVAGSPDHQWAALVDNLMADNPNELPNEELIAANQDNAAFFIQALDGGYALYNEGHVGSPELFSDSPEDQDQDSSEDLI